MAREYETQVLRPADGPRESIPKPAVRLGQRLAQLNNSQGVTDVRVIIVAGTWFLVTTDGKSERLGDDG